MLKMNFRYSVPSTVHYFKKSRALTRWESRGIWMGKGAQVLSLEIPVQEEELAVLLTGHAPSGKALYSRYAPNRRVCLEAVLAPHKSISIAASMDNEEQRDSVRKAWGAAMASWFLALETMAVCRITGKPSKTGNMLAAVFTHEVSRYGDPHLHTHFLILNTTQDPDTRRWFVLEPVTIFKARTALEQLFQRELCRELQLRGWNAVLDKERCVTTLPVPESACLRLSKGHAAIQAKTRLQESVSQSLQRQKKAEDRMNDRIRPRKTIGRGLAPLMTPEEEALFQDQSRIPELMPDPAPKLVIQKAFCSAVSRASKGPATWGAIAQVAIENISVALADIVDVAEQYQEADSRNGANSQKAVKPIILRTLSDANIREAQLALRIRSAGLALQNSCLDYSGYG